MSDDIGLTNDECRGQSSVRKIYHFDFYRIRRLQEAYDLGFEDYLYSGHICFIEWPQIVEDLLPDDAVQVHIRVNPVTGSRIVA
jgi:tRNA threonylcarbamoyladenosine biosynthesis protein TsaE